MTEDASSIDWAAIATFCAVLVALGIGIYNGWRTKTIEKKRYKLELLKEIINWAIALYKTPTEIEFPTTSMPRIDELALEDYPEKTIEILIKREKQRFKTNIEYQKSMSFMRAFALSDYIRVIAETHFKKQLLNRVKKVT